MTIVDCRTWQNFSRAQWRMKPMLNWIPSLNKVEFILFFSSSTSTVPVQVILKHSGLNKNIDQCLQCILTIMYYVYSLCCSCCLKKVDHLYSGRFNSTSNTYLQSDSTVLYIASATGLLMNIECVEYYHNDRIV
jgi:hypothetical protein